VVVAETIYVLESFYEAPRERIAEAIRSLIAFDSIVCVASFDRSVDHVTTVERIEPR
jgi:predicted nucleic-acid-binding protein